MKLSAIALASLWLAWGPSAWGQFAIEATPLHPLTGYSARVLPGDFDGDGHLDLISVGFSTGAEILLGNGTGSFVSSGTVPFPGSSHDAATGDIDGDGLLDLVVANNADSSVDLYLGTAPGLVFASSIPFPDPSLVGLEDLDGDDTLDLVIGGNSGFTTGEVELFLGDGAGGFSSQALFTVGPYTVALFVGDYDLDGAQDLRLTCSGIVPGPAGGIYTFLGDGAGGYAAPAVAAGHFSHAAQGDFDGDGILDLAFNVNNDIACYLSWYVWFGDGLGGFESGGVSEIGCGPYRFLAADLDLDADDDLVVANPEWLSSASPYLALYENTGSTSFAPPYEYFLTESPGVMAQGDYDEDGRIDIVVTQGPQFQLLLNRTGLADPEFLRGDVTGEGGTDISDAVALLAALFIPGSEPLGCEDAADFDDDGSLLLGDPVQLLSYLFVPGSPSPASPFPLCGPDPSGDGLDTCLYDTMGCP